MRRFNKCTISFNEAIKGWTQFWSFKPDLMIGMNSDLYTFHNGDLYRSFEPTSPRNTYYGETYPSKLTLMVNADASTVKELQALKLEGNMPWNIRAEAFMEDSSKFMYSTIENMDFIKKEGFWYTYARRNEDVLAMDSKAVYGIGIISSVDNDRVIINGFSDIITAGDMLYDLNLTAIGTIKEITRTLYDTSVILDVISQPVVGKYVFGGKDPKIEGGNLRGYVLKFDMDITTTDKVELFAVNSEVIKSYPS